MNRTECERFEMCSPFILTNNSCSLIITLPQCQTSRCHLKDKLWAERLYLFRQNLDFVRKHHKLCESFVRKERNDCEEQMLRNTHKAEQSVALHFDPRITAVNSWRNGLWEASWSYTHTHTHTHSVQSTHLIAACCTYNEDHNYYSKCYEALHRQKRTLLKQVTGRVCCVLL